MLTYARRIPAAVVTDCCGVYDALARSASSSLNLKDKKSGLEALAIKQSLCNPKTSPRWCHSFAQLADCMTKDDNKSRESFELFQKRKYHWKLVSDPSFTAAKKRTKLGLDVLDYVPIGEAETEMTVPATPVHSNYRSIEVAGASWISIEMVKPLLLKHLSRGSRGGKTSLPFPFFSHDKRQSSSFFDLVAVVVLRLLHSVSRLVRHLVNRTICSNEAVINSPLGNKGMLK